ncbi:sigma-70 family RNA polymerase sigma factor [Streptomyces hygroscopicus]|uniref:sigma-70 family RNA polymerase sigma factor n=1 Tax=Streptomyces hygroscopicus TaxID=1912 RepID=UPI00099C4D24|nr:sigma-70 family RNA polymerase sigma factor [Streptomyces hygroscopicus]
MRDDDAVTSWALAARDGDPDAVEAFVRATRTDVRRYVAHLSGDPQAVDDLVQDTYLRALRSLRTFQGRASARTWLLVIARRVVADRIRQLSARPRLATTHDWQAAAERTQPRDVPGFEESVVLGDLLAALPGARREAFVLTQLLGLTYPEAATVARCPVGTIRSRVARARETLIAQLTSEEEEPAGPERAVGSRADCPRPPDTPSATSAAGAPAGELAGAPAASSPATSPATAGAVV